MGKWYQEGNETKDRDKWRKKIAGSLPVKEALALDYHQRTNTDDLSLTTLFDNNEFDPKVEDSFDKQNINPPQTSTSEEALAKIPATIGKPSASYLFSIPENTRFFVEKQWTINPDGSL